MGTAPRLAKIGLRTVSATSLAVARTLVRPVDAVTQSIGVGPIKTWRLPDGSKGDFALGSLHSAPVRVSADDGAELYAEVDEGDDGYGLTVVFTHGYTANRQFWHYQRLALRGKVRMVFWDFRGHGRSPLGPSPVTVDRLAADLLLVVNELAPTGPIILVGHSMGGMTIMALARHHPELFGPRVKGVGLLGTSAKMVDYDVGLRRVGHTLWQVVPGTLQRTIGRPGAGPAVRGVRRFTQLLEYHFMREALFGPEVSDELLAFTTDMVAQAAFENLGDVLSLFQAHDVTAALHAMSDIEGAVITGDRDAILPVAHSSVIAEGIPRALFSVIPGGGHHVPLELPELVNPHLFGLLQRVRYRLSTEWYAAQDTAGREALRRLRDAAIARDESPPRPAPTDDSAPAGGADHRGQEGSA